MNSLQNQTGILAKIDGNVAVHAVVIAVVLILAYHLLFHR